MIRKRPLMPLLLLLVAVTTLADAQKAESRATVDSSAILESAMCLIRAQPMLCIRQQAARMLDNWEDILDAKKHEMMEEADKEAQKRQSRALNGDTAKQAKPSSLMNQIEDGLSIVADFVSDGVDSYSSDDSSKRKSVAEDAADVAGTGKKHLHHILHKLGSKTAATNRSEESGVARGSDATDLDEEVEAAVEDGFVDYGFGAGPEKAIGRGKRKGKKKKTYMKLFILGAALKGKIELLLKILSFHLQLKFFAIAAIGLLINIARFWIDIKKQPHPQKVIYYEHAQHQHHYDEGHGGGDEWNGGYWKRSLHNVHDDGPVAAASEPSYGYYAQERSEDDSGHHYRGQQHYVQQPQANNPSHYPYDPHSMAYNQQRPYA
ncbi:uncharacterized protein LOC6048750 isoform X2 [Culex quinquefasciatus]|uniref:uncharacterized protein LOC6048750 isoform X2 n=1 Tax=Culex quinquefasciatus TaxID=7176 RepID=UPI0018E3C965|nr:uncharacterized protein LOC6048750 isoform X2 [Culex quinquefasciatus]